MHLKNQQKLLTCLDEQDLRLAESLAYSRGCFTRKDYEELRQLSRRGAAYRLERTLLGNLTSQISASKFVNAPTIFFLKESVGRSISSSYKAPVSWNTAVDGVCRFAFEKVPEAVNWSHNLRGSSITEVKNKLTVFDCLDRNESKVLKKANELASGSDPSQEIQIITGSNVRKRRFEMMIKKKKFCPKSPKKSEEVHDSWDSLFGKDHTEANSVTQKPVDLSIRVIQIEHPIFKFVDKNEELLLH